MGIREDLDELGGASSDEDEVDEFADSSMYGETESHF